MPDEACDTISALNENIIHLFLTIRGFSVTKVKRNQLGKDGQKSSSGLRGVLKEKVQN